MINDFNDGAVGWTGLNILLDEQGGPGVTTATSASPRFRGYENG
jgi:hypothetical protein